MLQGNYIKWTLLILVVAFLAAEGYFAYQWYGQYSGDPAADSDTSFSTPRDVTSAYTTQGLGATTPEAATPEAATPEATTPEATTPEATTPEGPVEERRDETMLAAFVHRATPENIVGNSIYVDHPLANGNPNALLSVTPNWNPGGGAGTYNDHPVGVWYDADEERWAIFNQDLVPMPEGAAFNVAVSRGSRSGT